MLAVQPNFFGARATRALLRRECISDVRDSPAAPARIRTTSYYMSQQSNFLIAVTSVRMEYPFKTLTVNHEAIECTGQGRRLTTSSVHSKRTPAYLLYVAS